MSPDQNNKVEAAPAPVQTIKAEEAPVPLQFDAATVQGGKEGAAAVAPQCNKPESKRSRRELLYKPEYLKTFYTFIAFLISIFLNQLAVATAHDIVSR